MPEINEDTLMVNLLGQMTKITDKLNDGVLIESVLKRLIFPSIALLHKKQTEEIEARQELASTIDELLDNDTVIFSESTLIALNHFADDLAQLAPTEESVKELDLDNARAAEIVKVGDAIRSKLVQYRTLLNTARILETEENSEETDENDDEFDIE